MRDLDFGSAQWGAARRLEATREIIVQKTRDAGVEVWSGCQYEETNVEALERMRLWNERYQHDLKHNPERLRREHFAAESPWT
jgi:glycerol-3-phosphate O-acyltransferase